MANSSSALDRIFRHWAWAIPVILIVAALSIRQFDLYKPSLDEFYSLNSAGLVIDGPLSPMVLISRLHLDAPDHMPGYFLFLSAWGNLVSSDLAIARVAGIIALVIVSSNTHFNIYYDHVRMYSLTIFISGIILWLYLRMVYQPCRLNAKYVISFTAATVALISLQVLAAFLLLAALSLYHLFFVKKTRRWLAVPMALIVAIICVFPAIAVVAISGRISWQSADFSHEVIGGIGLVDAHLAVMLNNQPVLLLPALAGLLFIVVKEKTTGGRWLIIWCLGLAVMALFFEFFQQFGVKHMRYGLSLLSPFALFMAAGIYSLYRLRSWAILLLLLYVIAGLVFQQSKDWKQYLTYGRINGLVRQPIHIISRMVLAEEPKPLILMYADYHHPQWWWGARRLYGHSEKFYFFTQHDVEVEEISANLDSLTFDPLTEPAVWISYQTSIVAPDLRPIVAAMLERHYQLCYTKSLSVETVILQFRWRTLECDTPPRLVSSNENEVITYRFYGAEVDPTNAKLLFSDHWRGKANIEYEDYAMSYQVVSTDWEVVAQLDLGLWSHDRLRQLTIDIAQVPPGTYRLMAIVYDPQSRERLPWHNNADWIPEMLPLANVDIPP